jgi:hypothetical protein
VGHVGHRHDAARPRHRAALQGRRQRAQPHQPGPGHRQVRQARLRGVHDHRAGQRPGRARARPQVRPAARQPRHHQPRAPRRGGVGVGLRRRRDPRQGHHRPGDHRGDPRGQIKGLLSICFNPLVSLPDSNFTKPRRSTSSSSTPSSTSSCPSPPSTPTSCCPARCTRRTRARSTSGRGPDHQDQRRGRPAGRRPAGLADPARASPNGSARASTSTTTNTEEIFDELKVPRHGTGGTADYNGMTWERIEDEQGLFWPSPRRATPARHGSTKGGQFAHPDGKARFHGVPTVHPPRSSTTTTRCG